MLQSAPLAAYAAAPPPLVMVHAAERSVPALLQAPPLHADQADADALEVQAADEVMAEHNCRPRCIWGDAVCRALLGERWSDTGERCDADGVEQLAPELQGDDEAQPPYVSAPQAQRPSHTGRMKPCA